MPLIRSAAPPPIQALIPEFKVCESSDLKLRGAPAVKAPSGELKITAARQCKAPPSAFKLCNRSDFEIRGAQSGSSLAVQGL